MPDSTEWIQLSDDKGRTNNWNRRTNEPPWKPPPGIRSSGSARRARGRSSTSGTRVLVPVVSLFLLCLLSEAHRVRGFASPHPILGAILVLGSWLRPLVASCIWQSLFWCPISFCCASVFSAYGSTVATFIYGVDTL